MIDKIFAEKSDECVKSTERKVEADETNPLRIAAKRPWSNPLPTGYDESETSPMRIAALATTARVGSAGDVADF